MPDIRAFLFWSSGVGNKDTDRGVPGVQVTTGTTQRAKEEFNSEKKQCQDKALRNLQG